MESKEIDSVEIHDGDQVAEESVRRFIRHPAEFPLFYSMGSQQEHQQSLRDVSCGGLCFVSDNPMQRGESVHITIPVESPGFEADAVVAWCHAENDHYTIGVEFDSDSTSFAMRMVEQVCHIEQYRREVERRDGRVLTSEQAAEEWIAKYAKDFPRH